MGYTVTGGEMPQAEAEQYVKMLKEKYPERIFKDIQFRIDGDYVDISYHYEVIPFDRIRRITGYLVGTLDRFNDAKRAEVGDRVKHDA